MVVKKVTSLYTLNKMKRVLRQHYRLYRKKSKTLDPASKERLQSHLTSLQTALLQKDAAIAAQIGEQLSKTARRLMPRTAWDKTRDFILAVGFALMVAVAIRTMWFEPYTIPTGSMRPTLKEGDFLVVSKTDYGINVPLRPAHFYFDPTLAQRGGIFVFSGENMDIADGDTTYFYLFPGKKLFVKRLMGKPGDVLYFYGGQIYGINAQGKEITALRNPEWMQSLEHIPFIRFEGKVETSGLKQGVFTKATFSQMNIPVAKLSLNQIGAVVSGEMLAKQGMGNYYDLWGFKNYAMARLLTSDQAEKFYPGSTQDIGKGILFLELTHHPNFGNGSMVRDENNRLRPDFGTHISLMALSQAHVKEISRHLTTCRFVVEKGAAYRYGMHVKDPASLSYLPHLPDVPDGTYEIQNGKAYKVLWGGATSELSADHPLYRNDPERVQLLYNLGIEFVNFYNPSESRRIHPSRYAYFRDHDLYLLGSPIVLSEDPEMTLFLKKEYQKQSMSTSVRPYFPFDDAGPPLTSEGKIDADFIRKFGLTVPDKMYLALGDNHAMSADSRAFGFVPEENIRGGPSFLFWPPGERWGRLAQPPFPHLTFPNVFVIGGAIAIGFGASYYLRRRLQKPFKFD
jgi:signal peptidase I